MFFFVARMAPVKMNVHCELPGLFRPGWGGWKQELEQAGGLETQASSSGVASPSFGRGEKIGGNVLF